MSPTIVTAADRDDQISTIAAMGSAQLAALSRTAPPGFNMGFAMNSEFAFDTAVGVTCPLIYSHS